MNILLRLLINTIIILLVAYILPGFKVDGPFIAIIVAVVLGIVNITLKPILLLLTLPINILTLGLFTFVINALMLLVAAALVPGFEIEGFFTALAAALVIAVLHFLTYKLGATKN